MTIALRKGPSGPRASEGDVSTVVHAGSGIAVDNTDPLNPIVSALAFQFADVAALAANDVAEVPDGTIAHAGVINDGYVLNKNPSATLTAAIDGVSVVSATGVAGAVWVRLFWRNYDAWRQPTWYVDSTNGDDTNSGTTVGAPLRTLIELGYRLSGAVINIAMRVNLAASAVSYGAVSFNVRFGPLDGACLIVQGAVSSSAPVALLSATAEAPATNGRGAITSAGTFVLGQRLRLVATANPAYTGAMAFVTRVVGPGSANVNQWAQISSEIFGTTVNQAFPSAGDQYVVDTLGSTIQHINIVGDGMLRTRVMVRDCIVSPTVRDTFSGNGLNLMTAACVYACTYVATADWQNCNGLAACCSFPALIIEGGHVNLAAVVVFGGFICVNTHIALRGSLTIRSGTIALQVGSQLHANGPAIGFFDTVAATAVAIVTGSFMFLSNARLFGSDNTIATGVGVGMNSSGSYISAIPVLAVTTNEVVLNGVGANYADNLMNAANGAVWGLAT